MATQLDSESRTKLSAVEAAMWRQCGDGEGLGGLGGEAETVQIGSSVRAWERANGRSQPAVTAAVSHWLGSEHAPDWVTALGPSPASVAVGTSHPGLASHGVDLATAGMSFGGNAGSSSSGGSSSGEKSTSISAYRGWSDAGGWNSMAWATGVVRQVSVRNLLPLPVRIVGAFSLDPRVVVVSAPEEKTAHPGDAWYPLKIAVLTRPGNAPVLDAADPAYDPD